MAAGDTYKLGPGVLKIGATGTEIDVSCLVNNAVIAAEKDQGDSTTKLCGTVKPGAIAYTYTLGGNVDTDISDPAGLFALSQEVPGTEQDFTFTPSTAAGTVATGVLIIDPLDFGGDTTGEYMVSDFEFALVGPPVYDIGGVTVQATMPGEASTGDVFNAQQALEDQQPVEAWPVARNGVEVRGATRLAATLHLAAARVQDMSKPGRQAASMISARGVSGAPRRSGALAASVRPSANRGTAEITSGLAYAARTHWGYRAYQQAAQPFLADPAHALEPVWLGLYADECDRLLGQVKGV